MKTKACIKILTLVLGLAIWPVQAALAAGPELPTFKPGQHLYVLGEAPKNWDQNQVASALKALESESDAKFRLVLLTKSKIRGDDLTDFGNRLWDDWASKKSATYKPKEAFVIIATINPPRVIVRIGQDLRDLGVHHGWVEKHRKSALIDPLARGDTSAAFLDLLGAFNRDLRSLRSKKAKLNTVVAREIKVFRSRVGKALDTVQGKLVDLDLRVSAIQAEGQTFTNTDDLSKAQDFLSKARTVMDSEPGMTVAFCERAKNHLDHFEDQLDQWLKARSFVETKRPKLWGEVGEIEKQIQKKPDWIPQATKEKFQNFRATLQQSLQENKKNPLRSREILRQAEIDFKAFNFPPFIVDVEVQKGEKKGSGGWLALLVLAGFLAFIVMLLYQNEDASKLAAELPKSVQMVEAQLDDLHKKVLTAQTSLRSAKKPLPRKVPVGLAEYMGLEVKASKGEEDKDEAEERQIEIDAAPIYRGSTDRRLKRAKIAYKDIVLVYNTLSATVEEAHRHMRAKDWKRVKVCVERATRAREADELLARLNRVIGEVRDTANRLDQELLVEIRKMERMETAIDEVSDLGLPTFALKDTREAGYESLNEAVFLASCDPLRAVQHLERAQRKRKHTEASVQRMKDAMGLYGKLAEQMQKNSDSAQTPYGEQLSFGQAREQLRIVGSALNNGQLDFALELLDKAEEHMENAGRVGQVLEEAKESFKKDLESSRKETKELEDRVSKADETYQRLLKKYTPESIQTVSDNVAISKDWVKHFKDIQKEVEAKSKGNDLLEARLLLYYLAEKQNDISVLLDSMTARDFELEKEKGQALGLIQRLKDQYVRLGEYFEREKTAVRENTRGQLEKANEELKTIEDSLEDKKGPKDWPKVRAQLHECAQLFDLARNSAEQDAQKLRQAWCLQTSVATVLQVAEDDLDEGELKAQRKIVYDSLQARFERVRRAFGSDQARWDVVGQQLTQILRRGRSLFQTDPSIQGNAQKYARKELDEIANSLRSVQFMNNTESVALTEATDFLKQATNALEQGQFEKALDLACKAEDSAEKARQKASDQAAENREQAKRTLFDELRRDQRQREALLIEQNGRETKRLSTWFRFGKGPKVEKWSESTFWTKGLSLGMLDPLPARSATMFKDSAPEPEEDMLDTKRLKGIERSPGIKAYGDTFGNQQDDPFAAFAADHDDPFAAFAGDPNAAISASDPFAAIADPTGGFGASPSPAKDSSDAIEVEPEPLDSDEPKEAAASESKAESKAPEAKPEDKAPKAKAVEEKPAEEKPAEEKPAESKAEDKAEAAQDAGDTDSKDAKDAKDAKAEDEPAKSSEDASKHEAKAEDKTEGKAEKQPEEEPEEKASKATEKKAKPVDDADAWVKAGAEQKAKEDTKADKDSEPEDSDKSADKGDQAPVEAS